MKVIYSNVVEWTLNYNILSDLNSLKPTLAELEIVEIKKLLVEMLAYLEARSCIQRICKAEVGIAVLSELIRFVQI